MSHPVSKDCDHDLSILANELFQILDGHIVMGTPIGIGKAPQLINALYEVAKKNPHYRFDILTALSLNPPKFKSDLERRLLAPFFERQFKGVPELTYVDDAHNNTLPDNVNIIEFYFKPGDMIRNPRAQQNVLSANYTHIARDLMLRNVNLIVQMIAKQERDGHIFYSLSSNPDLTLDLHQLMREKTKQDGRPRLLVGQVNTQMPFMPNDAEVTGGFFDRIADNPSLYTPLFGTPQQPISLTDHMIGFYTSTLIKDGGTLQIGIGSLGDAIVNALLFRHQHNADYQAFIRQTHALKKFPSIAVDGGHDTFNTGLYGNTEMLVPGYIELKKGGVLKRKVYDNLPIQRLINQGLKPTQLTFQWLEALSAEKQINTKLNEKDLAYLQYWGLFKAEITLQNGQLFDNNLSCTADLSLPDTQQWITEHALGQRLNHARLIHAGFFVGTNRFYDDLRSMPKNELAEINMTSVEYTNQLLGQESLKIAQRQHARFINACMKVTLSGAAVSDGLADGKVVSGVGGQFNFVDMAQRLPDARSILMMRATRRKGAKVVSNVVFNYGHATIPRHMKDIIITEYGIADLRAKNDQEVIEELLSITDSRFQKSLIKQAQKAGKLRLNYQLHDTAKNNTPEAIRSLMQETAEKYFKTFPFGKELTEQEVLIGSALRELKTKRSKPWTLIPALIWPSSKHNTQQNEHHLKRLGLLQPDSIKAFFLKKLVLSVLPTSNTTSELKPKTSEV